MATTNLIRVVEKKKNENKENKEKIMKEGAKNALNLN
jgi:hypothetical protein